MWNIQTFDEIASTQTLARQQVDAGKARDGDVFVALHQHEGRGQYHWRLWYDEPGANLLLSTVLTNVPPSIVDLMQFVAGLSVLSTIRSLIADKLPLFDTARVKLKWPNDILIDGKKISGILSEAIWNGLTLKCIIIGIGINVNQEKFAEPVALHASSLKIFLTDPLPLELVRDRLLNTLRDTLPRYSDRQKLLTDLRSELLWMNLLPGVTATSPDGTVIPHAKITGISETGALHISTPGGVEHILQIATLTFDE
ncbi:MAG TPA: biotin--[acetyl-CoA-carboxylase] ligase [Candidatus Kapabacteria bacterium]|nr:biotin--[acetyl-CoA-carboxylase] ligase [Candidatus Kapabacteria bacterium]